MFIGSRPPMVLRPSRAECSAGRTVSSARMTPTDHFAPLGRDRLGTMTIAIASLRDGDGRVVQNLISARDRSRLFSGLDPARECSDTLSTSVGGVLVSTWRIRQRRHAEDGPLASLIIEPKNKS